MIINEIEVTNFASYPSLKFQAKKGLALISGPTGSGKSTIMDAVCWTIFGRTAKDGSVDEVRSWTNSDVSTTGYASIVLKGFKTLEIFRTRGDHNDLYWLEGDTTPKRGKDLSDTQKLVESILGVTFEQFVLCSYFHEFSPVSLFFTSNAKSRRTILEQVADLSLPASISDKSARAKKESLKTQNLLDNEIAKNTSTIEFLGAAKKREESKKKAWDSEKEVTLAALKHKAANFEQEKELKIKEANRASDNWKAGLIRRITRIEIALAEAESKLDPGEALCPECGHDTGDLEEAKKTAFLRYKKIKDEIAVGLLEENPHLVQVESALNLVNSYDERFKEEQIKRNPFDFTETQSELLEAYTLKEKLQKDYSSEKYRYNALSRIYELSFDLRAALLSEAIKDIEKVTNGYLEKYFESEIKVSFELEGVDSIKVEIQKSGYSCVYRQLSKGQRGLLRLGFSAAMMEVSSNNLGVHFSGLMFDEALDGLDTSLKLKAFRLFQELSNHHPSVMVIDHSSELKELFDTRIEVTMEADASRIEEV